MTQTPGQDPDKDERMASALERGMPTGLAAQAIYGADAAPSRTVSIEMTISIELEPGEVWPDGEPESWTAADVLAEAQKSSTRSFIADWDLDTFGAEVEVQALGTSARGRLR